MKYNYCLKSYHSEDKHETVIEPEISLTYCKQQLSEIAKYWKNDLHLKVARTANRVEAKGATYSMAMYYEKNA